MTAKEMLELLVDVFAGSDGCHDLLKFRFMLEQMEQNAANGDASAAGVVQIAERFCRLVKLATGKPL